MYKSMQGYPPNRIEGTETEQTIWCWESVDIQVFADHNENLQKWFNKIEFKISYQYINYTYSFETELDFTGYKYSHTVESCIHNFILQKIALLLC